MSKAPQTHPFAGLLTGRWQAPAAMLAVAAVAWAVTSLKPAPRPIQFDAILADVYRLRDGKAHYDAANAIANLLQMKPPLSAPQRAILNDTLSEVIYEQELMRRAPLRANAEKVLEHYREAIALGHVPDEADLLRVAKAREWLGESQEAIRAYTVALERSKGDESRRQALQALVRLVEGRSDFEQERREWIEALLADPGGSPSFQWVTLLHALQDAFDREDLERARLLATRYGARFERSDLRGYFEYVWAWVNTEEGRYDEAEPQTAWVEEWLSVNHDLEADDGSANGLRVLNRWLAGRVLLAQGRPQEALTRFEQAIGHSPIGEARTLILIGKAQALAGLERLPEALDVLREAESLLQGETAVRAAVTPKLRRCALLLAQHRQEMRDAAGAVACLDLCLEFTPTDEIADRLRIFDALGRSAADAARLTEEGPERSRLHARSGWAFERASELDVFHVAAREDRVWAASLEYDLAGQSSDARRMLLGFVRDQAQDARIPSAMLRIGQSYSADGLLDEAITWYARLAAEFPALEEAAYARLMLGENLVAQGESRWGRAEETLLDLLASDGISPEAQVYRDALFALADLFYQQGRYSDAISRLEDFRELYRLLYPDMPERQLARFTLGDCYRQSAYALRANQAEDPQAEAKSANRFRRAAALFAEYLEHAKESDNLSDELYNRLALFYRGDCLFELREPGAEEEALAVYRQAAARTAGRPGALAAQVQIANIYLRQGKLAEAARAVEKARWMLGTMPDEAFAGESLTSRDGWERYLATVAGSDLLAAVFEGASP